MRVFLILCILIESAQAGAPRDDAALTRALVGTWQGGRHSDRYFSDGTWMMDPDAYDALQGQNTHGRWYIKDGNLIETWRYQGETQDSKTTYKIDLLTAKVLKFHEIAQDGPGRPPDLVLPSTVFTLPRIPDVKIPGHP
jgi:hypothetical protein